MESVTRTRRIEADPETVAALVADVEPFMVAGGFTSVEVDGDTVEIANRIGLATLRLTLRLLDDEAAVLSFEQVEGPFDEMRTRYVVEPAGGDDREPVADAGGESGADRGPTADADREPAADGERDEAEVIAETEFTLGGTVIGQVLDAWIVRRQRAKELEAQFDYLESAVAAE